jgi:hypothetical protein
MTYRRSSALLAAALLAAAPLTAQAPRPAAPPRGAVRQPTPAAVRAAVETITEADFRQRLSVIADDSMRGRDTPSPELEKTAAYIADAFRRFGLAPGGDSGTYFQRYPIRRTQVDSGAYLAARVGDSVTRWTPGVDLALLEGALPDSLVDAPAVLMIGLPADSAHPFGDVEVRGAVVFQALPLAAQLQQSRVLEGVMKGAAAGARAWVFLVNLPAPLVANLARRALGPQYTVPGLGGLLPVPLLLTRDSTLAGLLRAAGEDLAAVRDTAAHRVRPLPGVAVTLHGTVRLLGESSAPNVIGVLQGSDPRLRDEYLLITGHMDHVGVAADGRCTAVGADSICNGADDDGSGTIGVVELAQAFARLRPRPARTLVFMTVSGEERGLWGSEWWADYPTRPLAQAAADIQLDMIGRYFQDQPGWRDTVAVVGKDHSTLGAAVDRANAAHPDLHMLLVDDPWHGQFYMQSDHYSFARKGVPAIFFFNGVYAQLHTPKDELSAIDAEKAARILKMVFYVALDVANGAQRPQWDPAARARIVEGAGNR